MPKKIRRKRRRSRTDEALTEALVMLGPAGRAAVNAISQADLGDVELLAHHVARFAGLLGEGPFYAAWLDDDDFADLVEPRLPEDDAEEAAWDALFVECAPQLYAGAWPRELLGVLAEALELPEVEGHVRTTTAFVFVLLAGSLATWAPADNPIAEAAFFSQLDDLLADPFSGLPEAVVDGLNAFAEHAELGATLPVYTEDERLAFVARLQHHEARFPPHDLDVDGEAAAAAMAEIITASRVELEPRLVARLAAVHADEALAPELREAAAAVGGAFDQLGGQLLLVLFSALGPDLRDATEADFVHVPGTPLDVEQLTAYRDWLAARGEDLASIDTAIEFTRTRSRTG